MTGTPRLSGITRLAFAAVVAVGVLALSGGAPYAQAGHELLSAAVKPPPRDLPWMDARSITVKFKPGIDRARTANVIQEAGCSTRFAARYVPGLMDIWIPAGADYQEYANRFADRLDVEYAHPTYLDHPFLAPDDTFYSFQWHLQQIKMWLAWDILPSRGSTSVIVAVQDTGVAYEDYGTYLQAPDLAGVNFVSPYDAVDGDGHPNDTNAHGTHVTGTIAQKTNNAYGTAGMADGVSIMPVRTLGAGGGSFVQFADGVHHAVDNGANIINYSGGGIDAPEKVEAVRYANTNGVLYIAAMGNDGVVDPTTGYPGRYPEAMGVVATDYAKARAPYSNWGADADISAPGGNTGADLNGDGYGDGVLQETYATTDDPTSGFVFQFFQGTSMATPHVSGLAALIWSQGRYTTAAAVRSRIESTAEDRGAAGKDSTFGWGLIRPDGALGPWLYWTGAAGYTADGVDPESGDAVAAATTFHYRVRYLDGTGAAPSIARVRIQRLQCAPTGGTQWATWSIKDMTLESGSIANGAVYHVATTLPANNSYRYNFVFRSSTGAAVGGPPSQFKSGPTINGRPKLCWVANAGFQTDGVNPNSGPTGTTFAFRVLYYDSAGTAPTIKELRIERNGSLFATKIMTLLSGGTFQTGRAYLSNVKLDSTGTYRYRFRFSDGTGEATGTPSVWADGPTVTDGGAATLGPLAVLPTHAGAQITFSLAGAANVTATVTNVAGRPIRTIVQDRPLEAGRQTLLWDRRADGGLAVPAGLYLIRVTARDADGAQSSALGTLSVR